MGTRTWYGNFLPFSTDAPGVGGRVLSFGVFGQEE